MQPLVLPNAKEKVEEATWLENWIRIIAIGYSFWDGFIDCFIIHLAMYLRNCEDPFALHWLLLLCLFASVLLHGDQCDSSGFCSL